jgi:oxaloacetate decarboxylase beta subunit
MRTKKYIFLLIAVLTVGISFNTSAQKQVQLAAQADTTVVANATTEIAIAKENLKTEKDGTISESFINFLRSTGFALLSWKDLIMLFIACILLYLAIVKGFEPLLLLPIAFGMFLSNLPGAGLFTPELFAGGHVDWGKFANGAGLLDYLYLGVKLGIYPCLIFVGVGAMTDFGPMLANPKSLLLGAAAQLGIFATYLGAIGLGFLPNEAASIGIIGGADGPTAIFLTSKLAPDLLGPIAVAAYSYMALVPVIQPPIMRLLTTKKERGIKMKQLRMVSTKEKIIFPVLVTGFISLLLPPAAPLIGSLMLGNLMRECGVVERLSKTVQNELMNITTIFLGITVGATATASAFLNVKTLEILAIGIVAFSVGTAGGVLLAKFMNLFTKIKINPLIGSAGVSAVPMAARVSQVVGQETDNSNFLLMHAMGPNVAGVIGSAVAAGIMLTMLS